MSFILPLFLFRQREKAAEKEKLKKIIETTATVCFILKVLLGAFSFKKRRKL